MRRCNFLDLVVLLSIWWYCCPFGGTVAHLVVLLPILATIYGRDLPNEDECPLIGISVAARPINDPEFSLFLPHPSDCHWYFHCSNGVAY